MSYQPTAFDAFCRGTGVSDFRHLMGNPTGVTSSVSISPRALTYPQQPRLHLHHPRNRAGPTIVARVANLHFSHWETLGRLPLCRAPRSSGQRRGGSLAAAATGLPALLHCTTAGKSRHQSVGKYVQRTHRRPFEPGAA